jgi:hypothetical protein
VLGRNDASLHYFSLCPMRNAQERRALVRTGTHRNGSELRKWKGSHHMQVVEIQTDFDLSYTAIARCEGWHVSAILRVVATRMGYLQKEDSEKVDRTLEMIRGRTGHSWPRRSGSELP